MAFSRCTTGSKINLIPSSGRFITISTPNGFWKQIESFDKHSSLIQKFSKGKNPNPKVKFWKTKIHSNYFNIKTYNQFSKTKQEKIFKKFQNKKKVGLKFQSNCVSHLPFPNKALGPLWLLQLETVWLQPLAKNACLKW